MAKLTKRLVDAAEPREKDYVICDDELPGFGLRIFTSGKRSYVLQYRALGRSRRYTAGLHGVWTAESARQEAKVQLGRVAQGGLGERLSPTDGTPPWPSCISTFRSAVRARKASPSTISPRRTG
jgi:hypothetical protein